MGTAKEEYKLSELINEIVEQDCELNELHYDDYKEITVIVENKYGGKYIYIDPEEDLIFWVGKARLIIIDNQL